MEFREKEIKLRDETICTLRSPNEHDAEKMHLSLKMEHIVMKLQWEE